MEPFNVSRARASGKPAIEVAELPPPGLLAAIMNFPIPVFIRALLATALLLLAGCATLPRASSDVAVTLADVRAGDATAFETHLTLVVRLTNRAPAAFGFSGARHEVSLNGRVIGTAVTNEALALPGLSTATQEVELNLSNFALIGLVRELQRNPSATYEIESTLFGSGAFARPLRTSRLGTVDLRGLAGAPAR